MYSIGFDIGSSSVKAALVEKDTGKVISVVKKPDDEMTIKSLNNGWAEQDPFLWWEYVCQSSKELIKKTGANPNDILTIGIAYQMHGLVIVDENLKPLRDSIIWCDSRAVEIGEKAFNELGESHCKEYLYNSPANFTASKLKWVMENEPEIYKKIYKFMLPGDFIALMFSGTIQSTPSGLSEGILWDFKNKSIANSVLEKYKISNKLVPEIVPTFSVQALVNGNGAESSGLAVGTKITYRAGDQPNNALALAVLNPGQVAATGGTSGVVYGVTKSKDIKEMTRINSFAHVTYNNNNQILGKLLNINGAGIQYSWLKKILRIDSYELMNEMSEEIPIGSDNLQVFPFGNGSERIFENKILDSNFKNINFNIHSPGHMCRATLEGIAFSFNYGIDILKNDGLEINVLKVGNDNLFKSKVFTKTLACLIDSPIERYNTTGAVGSARASSVDENSINDLSDKISNQDFVDSTISENRDLYLKAYINWKKNLEILIKNK
tara:strand:- start:23 stop:1504 length:1482 start_codon:yes stop_codon:yes gene_type:complete